MASRLSSYAEVLVNNSMYVVQVHLRVTIAQIRILSQVKEQAVHIVRNRFQHRESTNFASRICFEIRSSGFIHSNHSTHKTLHAFRFQIVLQIIIHQKFLQCSLPIWSRKIQLNQFAPGQCLSGRSTHVPLHALMLCGKEADVKEMYPAVEAMVTACPQAFGYRNGKKNTPLHLLCCAMPNLAPLLALAVQHCPQAFAQVDAIGKNPLHVLFSQSSVGGMGGTHSSILPHLQALFDNHTTSTFLPKGGGPARELLRKVDRNHNTPIHYLCQPRTRMTGRWSSFSSSFSHDLVTYLVAQCPQALAVKNQDGNTPLHLACSHPLLEIRLLAYMSEQYPSATLLLNRDGKCVSCLVKEPQASFDRIVAAMHQAVSVVVSLVYATPLWSVVR